MDSVPIDFPREAHEWAEDCTEQLEILSSSEHREHFVGVALSWSEPEDQAWSLLISEYLLSSPSIRDRLLAEPKSKSIVEQAIAHVCRWFQGAIRPTSLDDDADRSRMVSLLVAQHSAQLYSECHGLGFHRIEGLLLQNLFRSEQPIAIRLGIDLISSRPPIEWMDVSLALSPLMQSSEWNISDVFPKLLESADPTVLAPALDLANYAYRSRRLERHPAADRFESLLQVLSGIVDQLGMMEEDPTKFANTVSEIQRILFDSVSLCISLCDYMGLMGDQAAIGKLKRAQQLTHRRIKTEACFALATLGDSSAREALVELAADDSCRLRVISYSKELHLEDKIDAQWTTSLAMARAELALWLSQPERFAIAPHAIELVEQRTLYWPGYESPQECFLLRFEYILGDHRLSNIAIAGPTVHAFADDLGNLPIDDAFAVFLGHDIDHPESYELSVDQMSGEQRAQANEWEGDLVDRGFNDVKTEFWIAFFEHRAIIATADHTESRQTIVFDGENVVTSGLANQSTSLVALLWKGRLAMSSLNFQ